VGRDEDGAPTLPAETGEKIPDPSGVAAVETRRRLVGNQKKRAKREGTRHGDPLLFAARKGAWAGAGASGETHRLERLAGPLVGVGVAAERERKTHVLEDIEERKELDILEDEGEVGEAERGAPILVERVEIPTKETDPARAGGFEARGDRKKRRLARTRDAEDGRPLARFEGEGHSL
jgi:hypothetical protein